MTMQGRVGSESRFRNRRTSVQKLGTSERVLWPSEESRSHIEFWTWPRARPRPRRPPEGGCAGGEQGSSPGFAAFLSV